MIKYRHFTIECLLLLFILCISIQNDILPVLVNACPGNAFPGYYCVNTAMYMCSGGYKCSGGAAVQINCPAGTYTEIGETSCQICPIGHVCPYFNFPNGMLQPSSSILYLEGVMLYKNGTDVYPTDASTSAYLNGISPSQKIICQDRNYSSYYGNPISQLQGASIIVSENLLLLGIANSYNTTLNITFIHIAIYYTYVYCRCTPGFLCNVTGLSIIKLCPAGFYCPANPSTIAISCDGMTGVYCGEGTSWPLPCEKGFYCQSQTNRTACDPGTYNNITGSTSATDCIACPVDHYCPQVLSIPVNPLLEYYYPYLVERKVYSGAVNPTPCNPGTYNPNIGSSSYLACSP